MKHQHIDSTGAFDCPIGSACKLPHAGEQFDAMLASLQELYSDAHTGKMVCRDNATLIRLRKAIAAAEGQNRSRCLMTTKKLGEGATPGPWLESKIGNPYEQYMVYEENSGHNVAHSVDGLANARLIAKAPLLLEARDVLARFADIGSTQELPRRIRDLAHEARALLLKLDAE